VHAVFISDADMCEKVLRSDGKQPMHVVPRAWTLYNEL